MNDFTSTRRKFLQGASSGLTLAAVPFAAQAAGPQTVAIENFSAAARTSAARRCRRSSNPKPTGKKMLSPEQFEVTRHAGTEQAFTGVYAESKGGRALSLHLLRHGAVRLEDQIRLRHRLAELLAADLEEKRHRNQRPQFPDERVAVSCTRCDAHLGHVFTDGRSRRGCATA